MKNIHQFKFCFSHHFYRSISIKSQKWSTLKARLSVTSTIIAISCGRLQALCFARRFVSFQNSLIHKFKLNRKSKKTVTFRLLQRESYFFILVIFFLFSVRLVNLLSADYEKRANRWASFWKNGFLVILMVKKKLIT